MSGSTSNEQRKQLLYTVALAVDVRCVTTLNGKSLTVEMTSALPSQSSPDGWGATEEDELVADADETFR